MTKPTVLIYRPVDESGESHRRIEAAGCEVTVAAPGSDLSVFLQSRASVSALLGATFRDGIFDRPLLRRLPDLRIVSKYTIGVDDVDVDAATDLGVLVSHCPTEANWGGVAEGTLALMLALLKKVQLRNDRVKDGQWRSPELEGLYLGARSDGYAGLTVGIIGLGRVGRRVASLLAPWRVSVLASDPYLEPEVFNQYGVSSVDLKTLLGESDVVTIHCNLTTETRTLMDAQKLGWMKPSAVLINTARGAIVDVEAVCDVLDAGRLAGVALDVLPEEPPPSGARILATDTRVILSPHMVAANSGGTLAAAIPWATDATIDAISGNVPVHVYNTQAIPKWLARFGGRSLL